MEKFELTILGCGSALPTTKHFPTSQVINLREKLYMIDCGEGAQIQLRRSKLKFSRLNHIFISHLHGDHCFGIMGLVSTFGLLGRTAPLHIYAPADFEDILNIQLNAFCKGMQYEVVFHSIDTTRHQIIFEDKSIKVYSIPLHHRIPCCGFLFEEKPGLPHIIREMIDFYKIPAYEINRIKNGGDWITGDGKTIPNKILTKPANPARSYAYCSDTIYMPSLKEYIHEATLLFHEATFLDKDRNRAKETCHTTSLQAATLAKEANVKQLCIGHFSARYDNENLLLEEARTIFSNTILAKENLTIEIK